MCKSLSIKYTVPAPVKCISGHDIAQNSTQLYADTANKTRQVMFNMIVMRLNLGNAKMNNAAYAKNALVSNLKSVLRDESTVLLLFVNRYLAKLHNTMV